MKPFAFRVGSDVAAGRRKGRVVLIEIYPTGIGVTVRHPDGSYVFYTPDEIKAPRAKRGRKSR